MFSRSFSTLSAPARRFLIGSGVASALSVSYVANSRANDKMMKAVLLKAPGPAENMFVGEAPVPAPGAKELLVKVSHTAINRADTLQRKGAYPPPPGASSILGLECSGEVAEVGEGCTGSHKPGDRVMCLLAGGGYAEYATVPEGCAMEIPDALSMEQAAAVPETWLTAFQLLHFLGKVKKDEFVLIHAGASGVGTAAIQMCNLVGAKAIVTVGSQAKIDYCKDLGAVAGFNYKTEPFAPHVQAFVEAQGGKGVDLVLDCVGATHAHQNIECLGMEGRWVFYGGMGGGVVDKFPLIGILRKRIQLTGTTLRARSVEYKAELTQAFSDTVLPHMPKTVAPVVDRVYPLSQITAAHKAMEANVNKGKIVIAVKEE